MRSFSIKQTISSGRGKAPARTPVKPASLPELHPEYFRKLERAESIAYLHTLLPAATSSSDEELGRLAEILDNLPFALRIAGGYLQERPKTSIREYLAEVEKTASTLNPTVNEWIASSPDSPSNELASAITISYRLLEGKGERERLAQQVLFVASYCAPDVPIPFELFRQVLDITINKQPNLDRCLQWLYNLGFLLQADQGPVVHSILNGYARSINPEPTRLLTLLVETFLKLPLDTDASGFSPIVVTDHMRAVAVHAEEAGLKQAGAVWNSLGYFLWITRDLSEAKACLERCLAFNEQNYGMEHANTAIALSNLGRVLSDSGDLKAAKNHFERAMAINEKVFSASYPEVAMNANDLGQVLYDLGDLQGARICFERALSIHENAFGYGPKHAVIAIETGHLGRVLRDLHDLQGAKACFERALAVDEWVYGPRHPKIASRANYLGRVLYQLGDLQSAKTCFERAVAIENADPNIESAGPANALNNLALVLQDLGNLEEARECFEQVLAIDEKVHGPEHPTVAKDITSLGNVERDLGNLPAARDRFTRALKINEVIYGLVHPVTAANLKNLGRVLYSLGDLPGAKDAYQRALEIETKLLGADHVEVGTDVHNLGMVLFELGEMKEAQACYERALRIFEKKLSPDNIKRVKALQHLDRVKKRLKSG